ncbi:MAG TPA: hypothetical protein VF469_32870 [Kofleriaceae bacterium]
MVGKQTLVEQLGGLPAAADTRAAQPADASSTGLPRLQLKDIPAQPPATTNGPTVQRKPAAPSAATGGAGPSITPPKGGINKTGFIDNSDGAFIRFGPVELGGQKVRDQPLPPATRVFVSGTHPEAPEWWYVTAYLKGTMVRGYVQGHRVNTDLPEPLAELRQLVGGETPEGFAIEKFGHAVTDGHDLRYYENVLLYVNHGRAGITGTYQDRASWAAVATTSSYSPVIGSGWSAPSTPRRSKASGNGMAAGFTTGTSFKRSARATAIASRA